MKQFDSSIVGQPYSRVMQILIRYTAPMTAVVDVILQQHVKLLDGAMLGATMTMGQLFVGVSSLIREQELLVSGT